MDDPKPSSIMMYLKRKLALLFAQQIRKSIWKWSSHPARSQERVFYRLIKNARDVEFGRDHDFAQIKNHSDFVSRVPVRDYEGIKPYIDRIVQGENNVLWKGKPLYLAKTSGTTSGTKYIPITKASIKEQVKSSRNAILMYIAETKKTAFIQGKMIFIQGNPKLDTKHGIKIGKLSGISAHYVPRYLQKNNMPSWETNCIDNWEDKVESIVEETLPENMTVIAGIPSWVQTYFERLIAKSGKKVGELFQNFQLFIYGGVSYDPYRSKFAELIGKKVDTIELYPASEGFFAFQDRQHQKGLLLQLNSGIFYEFIKTNTFFDQNPQRLTISEVELGVNYVMLISTNAGLWAYNVGDTIEFTSLNPYRVIVTGRIKHFISAFGEHVIGKEVEQALTEAMKDTHAQLTEFTVAPQITPIAGLPYHEWLVEFEKEPDNIFAFAKKVDLSIQRQNIYYKDFIAGKVLQPLKITSLKKNSFNRYMKSIGKLGGQNKVPRLSNDRKIADELLSLQWFKNKLNLQPHNLKNVEKIKT